MASEHESSTLLSSQQLQALRSHNPVKQFLEIARNHPVLSERVRGAGLCLAARRVTYAPYGFSVSPTWWSVAGTGRRHRQEQRRPCSLQGARSFLVQAEQPWAKPEPSGWDRCTALGRACGRRCWQNSSAWPYSSCMEAGAVCRPPRLHQLCANGRDRPSLHCCGSANDEVAAFGNGLTLAVASTPHSLHLQPIQCHSLLQQLRARNCHAVYATANVSGGHLNPAVTFATCLTGHMSWPRGGLYCVAQLLGAIFGALVEAR